MGPTPGPMSSPDRRRSDRLSLAVGIDPGAHGAIGILDDGRPLVLDLPHRRILVGTVPRPMLDVREATSRLSEAIGARTPDVVVEAPGHVRLWKDGQGIGADVGLSLGLAVGAIHAMLYMMGLEYRTVEPLAWKTVILGSRGAGRGRARDGHAKSASVALAVRLWPVLGERRLRSDRAEALLLALYALKTSGRPAVVAATPRRRARPASGRAPELPTPDLEARSAHGPYRPR